MESHRHLQGATRRVGGRHRALGRAGRRPTAPGNLQNELHLRRRWRRLHIRLDDSLSRAKRSRSLVDRRGIRNRRRARCAGSAGAGAHIHCPAPGMTDAPPTSTEPRRTDSVLGSLMAARGCSMASTIKVHRFQASLFPVNAYLVETAEGVIAVDATLGVSDGRALAGSVAQLRKPLAGVLVTHSHPDHYGGIASLVAGAAVPVYAVDGVHRVTRRDDAAKENILRPMFGDEWASVRQFPNRVAKDGERLSLGGATFRVVDAGPSESAHDSWWVLEGEGPNRVFTGDLVYSHM